MTTGPSSYRKRGCPSSPCLADTLWSGLFACPHTLITGTHFLVLASPPAWNMSCSCVYDAERF